MPARLKRASSYPLAHGAPHPHRPPPPCSQHKAPENDFEAKMAEKKATLGLFRFAPEQGSSAALCTSGLGQPPGGSRSRPPTFSQPRQGQPLPAGRQPSRAEPSRTHLPPDPGAAPRPRILRLQPRPPPASPAPGAGWGHKKRHKARMEMPYGRSPVSAKNKLEAAGGLTVLEGCEKAYRRRCARLPAEISLPWIKGSAAQRQAGASRGCKATAQQNAPGAGLQVKHIANTICSEG